MYQTYISEALVCGKSDSQTADRSFLLFTREAGMLYAHAKSVREERSKQRYALQECSHIRVTLVRGKVGWKITGAEAIQNFYTQTETREARTFLRNTIRLLRRVIQGETAHSHIFDDVISACAVSGNHSHTKLENILALRILHSLGYIAPTPMTESFLHSAMPYDAVGSLNEADEKKCTDLINTALIESHL